MKTRIVIQGTAGTLLGNDDNGNEVVDVDRNIADGACYQGDDLHHYLDEPLRSLVTSSSLCFALNDKEELMSVVYYESTRQLDVEEIKSLIKFTSGQLSDGVGEGFEQQPFLTTNDMEYYLSPWHKDQVLEATQEIIEDE